MILDSLLKQAIRDFDKKKFQKSINLFEMIIEENPNNSEMIILNLSLYKDPKTSLNN